MRDGRSAPEPLLDSEVEAEIITKRYELMDDAVLTLHKSFFHFGTIQNWVNVHWRGSFTALCGTADKAAAGFEELAALQARRSCRLQP